MKKNIICIIIMLVVVSLMADIRKDEIRHAKHIWLINSTTMVATRNPLLSAGLGLASNTAWEFKDWNDKGKFDWHDFRTGIYCSILNVPINYGLNYVYKRFFLSNKPKQKKKKVVKGNIQYDPMLRNDPSKATKIDLRGDKNDR